MAPPHLGLGCQHGHEEAAETTGRPPFDPPEMFESDLSGLVLECARWGVGDPRTLRWRDPPPAAALDEARDRLTAIGAIDAGGRPTPHGERVAALPLAPVLGHMLVAASARGLGRLAARVALVLTERGLGGRSVDLDERLRLLARDRGPRAEAGRRLADRWAQAAGGSADTDAPGDAAAQVLAQAFPDRVARRRGPPGAPYLMANGRAVTIAADEPLATAPWIVVGDASGSAAGTRLLLGAAIDAATVEGLLAGRIDTAAVLAFDPATGGVTAETVRRLGVIVLGRAPTEGIDPATITATLLAGLREHGLALLPWGEASAMLRSRIAFAAEHGLGDLPDLSDSALLDCLDDWLAPLLAGKRRLGALTDAALAAALAQLAGWPVLQRLGDFAPPAFITPAGSSHAIDYAAVGGPAVDVRVQTLFGLAVHPAIADGRQPLTLRLTSPAGRPIQVTRDLPRFWAGSWADVRRELRGRYPKHPWPEDPAAAPPTLRAKRPGRPG